MKRLGAVIAAVAMVAISLSVRDRIDDDGDGDGGNGPLRLRCSTELAEACLALEARADDVEVTIEAAGSTVDSLLDPSTRPGTVEFDGWLVLAPWPDIARGQRDQRQLVPVLDPRTARLARSPLLMAVNARREGPLAQACGGTIGWRCVGDRAGTPWSQLNGDEAWGALKAGHADPTTSATGLLVLGQATTEYFDTENVATNDLDADEGFPGWLRNIEQYGSAPSFEELLASRFAEFDVIGTTEAEAGPVRAAAAPANRDDSSLLYLEPVVTADVVLATAAGSEGAERLRATVTGDEAAEVLALNGWRVEGQPRARGVKSRPALPDQSGLPSPGLLQQLQQRWREAR